MRIKLQLVNEDTEAPSLYDRIADTIMAKGRGEYLYPHSHFLSLSHTHTHIHQWQLKLSEIRPLLFTLDVEVHV